MCVSRNVAVLHCASDGTSSTIILLSAKWCFTTLRYHCLRLLAGNISLTLDLSRWMDSLAFPITWHNTSIFFSFGDLSKTGLHNKRSRYWWTKTTNHWGSWRNNGWDVPQRFVWSWLQTPHFTFDKWSSCRNYSICYIKLCEICLSVKH